jgi:hypothetical protein
MGAQDDVVWALMMYATLCSKYQDTQTAKTIYIALKMRPPLYCVQYLVNEDHPDPLAPHPGLQTLCRILDYLFFLVVIRIGPYFNAHQLVHVDSPTLVFAITYSSSAYKQTVSLS